MSTASIGGWVSEALGSSLWPLSGTAHSVPSPATRWSGGQLAAHAATGRMTLGLVAAGAVLLLLRVPSLVGCWPRSGSACSHRESTCRQPARVIVRR